MKKNHLALIFLTVITIISVWYLKSPLNNKNNDNNTDDLPAAAVPSRLEEISKLRDVVRSEREEKISSLDEILASKDTTIVEKASALSEKEVLSDLTEKEVLLEVQIINLGYLDAFVHSTSSGVEVLVVSDENSGTSALEIINMVYLSFEDTTDVVVKFQSLEELKKI